MSGQPEALRLAAELEACPTINYKAHAAELRRLHAELTESEKWRDRDEARAANAERERDIAEEQRDALLEALKEAEFVMDDCPMVSQQLVAAIAKARAAIKAAEENT